MKRIIRYNALGDHKANRLTSKRLTSYLVFLIYTPICHIVRLLAMKKQEKKEYKVSIAAIFKNEAQYLNEWICYHQLIGVEHMYLYNNFSDDNYMEVLTPYIDEGFVTLTDWPVEYGQVSAYTDCIERFRSQTNWIAFIDIDEFICLKEQQSLGDWLDNYRRYPSVMINWKMFGTSGLKERDKDRLIIEQFDSSWADFTDNGKSIINTTYKFKPLNHCHRFKASMLGLGIPPVDEFKNFVINWIYMPNIWRRESKIQINHYWSKAYNDFVYKDTIRGSAMSSKSTTTRRENLIKRFEYHEKMNTAKDHTIQHIIPLLKSKL